MPLWHTRLWAASDRFRNGSMMADAMHVLLSCACMPCIRCLLLEFSRWWPINRMAACCSSEPLVVTGYCVPYLSQPKTASCLWGTYPAFMSKESVLDIAMCVPALFFSQQAVLVEKNGPVVWESHVWVLKKASSNMQPEQSKRTAECALETAGVNQV